MAESQHKAGEKVVLDESSITVSEEIRNVMDSVKSVLLGESAGYFMGDSKFQ